MSPMEKATKEEKLEYLENKLRDLEKQLEKKVGRSQYTFEHGGDGWHDNASWEGICQDVGVLSALIRDLKLAIKKLKSEQEPTAT